MDEMMSLCKMLIIIQPIKIFIVVDKYDYQRQEAWDHYDESWDPYSRNQGQGQGYADHYYG